MAQIMATRVFVDSRLADRRIEGALQRALAHVVSLPASGDPIRRNGCRRKNIQHFRPFGPRKIDTAKIDFQHVFVKKQDRGQSLILGRSGDMLIHGEVREKLADLHHAHLARMALFMEEDKTINPIIIRFFRANAVVAGAQNVAHLFKQLRRLAGRR